MYSYELMKFLLDYDKREDNPSKKTFEFKDGNDFRGSRKLATIPIMIKNQRF